MKPYSIGIDAGGTKVAYGLFSSDGTLIDRRQHPSDACADGSAFADKMIDTIFEILCDHSLTTDDLLGAGVCMPSHILFDEGHIYMTSALPRIHDFPMRDYLQKRLGMRVVLDNDCNGAALAEHRWGAGRGSRHMIYMAVSTGIGSGIIIDGKLFRGSYGWAGECGHMLLTPNEGVECGCENRGCVMSYASGRFVPEHIRTALAAGQESLLSQYPHIDCKALLDAYHCGDVFADKMISSMAHYIAVCLYNLYQILNINVFVFGGGLTNFGPVLFDRIRAEFDRFNHIPLPVDFRFAELGQDFGIIGAAELLK